MDNTLNVCWFRMLVSVWERGGFFVLLWFLFVRFVCCLNQHLFFLDGFSIVSLGSLRFFSLKQVTVFIFVFSLIPRLKLDCRSKASKKFLTLETAFPGICVPHPLLHIPYKEIVSFSTWQRLNRFIFLH